MRVTISILVVVFVVISVRRLPWRDQMPWQLFAVGHLATAAGALVSSLSGGGLNTQQAQLWTAGAALLFLAANSAGMAVLIRRWNIHRDSAASIESAAVVVSLSLISWVWAIAPADELTVAASGDVGVRLAFVGAGLLEVALAVLVMRGGSRTVVAARLLTAATFLSWFGSILHIAGNRPMTDDSLIAWLSNTLWTLAMLLLAAAAAHPSAARLGRPASTRPAHSVITLAMLGGAAILPPVTLLVDTVRSSATVIAVAVASMLLVLLLLLRVGQLLRHVQRQSNLLYLQANRDELTTLPNRRSWSEAAATLASDSPGEEPAAAVAILDLDRFKLYNDTFGHAAGDDLLRSAAEAWRRCLRATDVLARHGGEEFVVLLPSPDTEIARRVLERMQEATPYSQSFSAGIARWEFREPVDAALARADEALYRAKAEGRRRVYIAPSPTTTAPARHTAPSPVP
ncbi:sensor domain-containing diguanylate cyclase [Cryptosporangium phraense]|uniref:GGDEF domain-containing protein n=1 Tax=Cryptosporangium phraense TaxID=2593070 RepID=UPI0014791BF3|nr:GGDEF domain-containing protein [Cryptosporangium phraense]